MFLVVFALPPRSRGGSSIPGWESLVEPGAEWEALPRSGKASSNPEQSGKLYPEVGKALLTRSRVGNSTPGGKSPANPE